MLISDSDLMPQLDSANTDGVLYVGRRVDQSWRRLEHFATKWLGDGYQDTDRELWPRDLESVAEIARRLPAIPAADAPADDWLVCARSALQIAGDAVHALRPDPHCVAVHLRIAREAFSLYRLAKYRWIERAVDPRDLARVGYQALEA